MSEDLSSLTSEEAKVKALLKDAKAELKERKHSRSLVAEALAVKATEFKAAEANVKAAKERVKVLKKEKGSLPMKKTLMVGAVAGGGYLAAKRLGLLDER